MSNTQVTQVRLKRAFPSLVPKFRFGNSVRKLPFPVQFTLSYQWPPKQIVWLYLIAVKIQALVLCVVYYVKKCDRFGG